MKNKVRITLLISVLIVSIFCFAACENESKPDQYEEYLGIYECTSWQAISSAQGTFGPYPTTTEITFQHYTLELQKDRVMAVKYQSSSADAELQKTFYKFDIINEKLYRIKEEGNIIVESIEYKIIDEIITRSYFGSGAVSSHHEQTFEKTS